MKKLFSLVAFLIPCALAAQAASASEWVPPPQCGPANLTSGVQSKPVEGLCRSGVPTTVRGAGPWTWFCQTSPTTQTPCVASPNGLEVIELPHANLAAIQAAVQQTINTFASTPNHTVILHFPAGTYDFSNDTSVDPVVRCPGSGSCVATNSIDLSGVTPGSSGRLILMGDGPYSTEFITNPDQVQFFGRNLSSVTIMGLHLTADRLTASQGHVVNPARSPYPSNVVVVDIENGFPQLQPYPFGLYRSGRAGRYLRKYLSNGLACHIDPKSPITQQAWDNPQYKPEPGHPNRWWLQLPNNETNPFADGDLVGIKAHAGLSGDYKFTGVSQFSFDHIVWTRRARGAFESGKSVSGGIEITDSSILLESPIDQQPICMSTSGGGPQFHGNSTSPTWGNYIDHFVAESTGDDSVASFDAYNPQNLGAGLTVTNSFITDSFVRSFMLYNTVLSAGPHVSIMNPDPIPRNILNTQTVNCNPLPNGPASPCILLNNDYGDSAASGNPLLPLDPTISVDYDD